jgi:phage shock protein B
MESSMAMIPLFVIGLLAALGLLVVGAILLVVFLASKCGGGQQRETRMREAHTMQNLHQGFARLEERIEAMETILLDRARQNL